MASIRFGGKSRREGIFFASLNLSLKSSLEALGTRLAARFWGSRLTAWADHQLKIAKEVMALRIRWPIALTGRRDRSGLDHDTLNRGGSKCIQEGLAELMFENRAVEWGRRTNER